MEREKASDSPKTEEQWQSKRGKHHAIERPESLQIGKAYKLRKFTLIYPKESVNDIAVQQLESQSRVKILPKSLQPVQPEAIAEPSKGFGYNLRVWCWEGLDRISKKHSSTRSHLPEGTSKDHSRGLSHIPSSDVHSPDNLANQTKCPISNVGMSKWIRFCLLVGFCRNEINTIMHTMTIILKR